MFSKDGADNYYVRTDEPGANGVFHLVFFADADSGYFAPSLPTDQYYTAAIVRKLEIGLGKVPKHVHHMHRMIADATYVVTEHTEDWCFADDHVVALPFVSIQEIVDGKIRLWRDYSNMDTLLSQAPQWWLDHIMSSWTA